MGKKKKSGGKKKAKSVRASSNTSSNEVVNKPQPLTTQGKEFYQNQVNDVEKRVAWLQRRCDELELLNGHFREQEETIRLDGGEVSNYLRQIVQDKTDTINELQEELRNLQEAHEVEQRTYTNQLAQLRKDYDDTKEQLTSEGLILDGKLSSLEEYRVQREELQTKFSEIQERIAKQSLIHKEEIYQRERQSVVDKDRLNKEMLQRVNGVANEFRKASNQQMAETTQKTIEENSMLNKSLSSLSQKITSLIKDNDSLRSEDKTLSMELKVLEDMDKEMGSKTANSLKTIRKLVDACRDADNLLLDLEEKFQDADDIETEHGLLIQQTASQDEELESLRTEISTLQKTIATQNQHIAEQRRTHRRFHRLLEQSQGAVSDSYATLTPDEEMTESEAVILRRKMLITILSLLNTAADLGIGPEPAVLGRAGLTDKFEHKPPSKAPTLSRGGPQFDLMSARLQELGLAPLKKVPSRSAGVQVGVMMPDKVAVMSGPMRRNVRSVPAGIF